MDTWEFRPGHEERLLLGHALLDARHRRRRGEGRAGTRISRQPVPTETSLRTPGHLSYVRTAPYIGPFHHALPFRDGTAYIIFYRSKLANLFPQMQVSGREQPSIRQPDQQSGRKTNTLRPGSRRDESTSAIGFMFTEGEADSWLCEIMS